MAEVWVAIDIDLDRKVAVKWLRSTLATDPVVTERFRREAIAVARLSHPNIVGVHDVFVHDGRQAVVMQLVDGKVEEGGKQRTRSKALKFLVDKVAEFDGQIDSVAVLHADCSDVDQFVEMLRPHYSGEIVIGDIGPVVGTHAGRGTIGVGFITRD